MDLRTLFRPCAAVGAALVAMVLLGCGDDGTGPVEELRIVTTDLADGEVGQPYSQGIDAEGGAGGYDWEVVEGSLPPGLVITVEDLSDDDLLVTGIPVAAGTRTFTVEVTGEGEQADSAEFTIQVLPPADLVIANVALPPAAVGVPVEIPLRARGAGTAGVSWELTAGELPPGLVLEPEGTIVGTATATGTWTFTVRASDADGSTFAQFTMRVVPHDQSGLNLTAFPVVPISEAIRPHVDAAIARWEEVLVGDLESGTIPRDFFGSNGCAGFGQEANGAAVDDLLVLVNIDSIDGRGGVLAQAGPCGIRDDDLPFVGVLTLDDQDLLPLVGTSTLTSIIAHEIGHVLGIGSLWALAGLLEGTGTDDPRYTGEAAVAEWHALGGTGSIPVENQGGQGTAESHLRESVFDTELMTGFSEPVNVPQPLSRITIAGLADLGFEVDLSAADPYQLPSAILAPDAATAAHLGYDIAGGVGPIRRFPLGRR